MTTIAYNDDQFLDIRGWSDTMEALANTDTEAYIDLVTEEILRDLEDNQPR